MTAIMRVGCQDLEQEWKLQKEEARSDEKVA